mmetsp:Transcript_29006/g.56789  ORF Transcript_29006/g.56789 Transcript_29006/m.56789 type:complete len:110 (-) Transcript_29006:1408-1737(-)
MTPVFIPIPLLHLFPAAFSKTKTPLSGLCSLLLVVVAERHPALLDPLQKGNLLSPGLSHGWLEGLLMGFPGVQGHYTTASQSPSIRSKRQDFPRFHGSASLRPEARTGD